MPDQVTCESDGTVTAITIDDGKRNALAPALLDDLDAAIDVAESASTAILLTGRPGAFSAGYDLNVIKQGFEATLTMMGHGGEILLRLLEFPRPVVIACSGHTLAGGALFLCVADRRIGALGDFKIGLNEMTIGLPLPGVAIELARHRLEVRSFVEATLEARIYDPEEAVLAGWLDAAVAPGELLAIASSDAQRLANLPAHAFEPSKKRLNKVLLSDLRSMMTGEMDDMTASLES